jgi:DNA-directed RNA polymerase subunit RPC12/RpoP
MARLPSRAEELEPGSARMLALIQKGRRAPALSEMNIETRNRCPKCHGQKLCHSRYRRFEKLKAAFFLRPYRCAECNSRFLLFQRKRFRRFGSAAAGIGLVFVLVWFALESGFSSWLSLAVNLIFGM